MQVLLNLYASPPSVCPLSVCLPPVGLPPVCLSAPCGSAAFVTDPVCLLSHFRVLSEVKVTCRLPGAHGLAWASQPDLRAEGADIAGTRDTEDGAF